MQKVNKVVLSSPSGLTVNGDTQDSQLWVAASFHLYTSGTADGGTFKLQASNDVVAAGFTPGATPPTVVNWVDIPSQTATITSGAPAILTITACAYRWLRAVYTKSSGSDAVIVQVMAIYP